MEIRDLLIITRVNKNPEVLPFIYESIKEAEKLCKGFRYDWYVVFNLESQEFISSRLLKFLSDKSIINFSKDNWNNVLNDVLKHSKTFANYQWYYILEEQNSIPDNLFIEISKYDNSQPLIVFRQMREDCEAYPKYWSSKDKKAVGILDFGQIVFNSKYLKYFIPGEISSGLTVESILNDYNGENFELNINCLTTRRGLQVPSTASKPKVLAPFKGNAIGSEMLEGMLMNPANKTFARPGRVMGQFSQNLNEQYNKMMNYVLMSGKRHPVISVYTSAYNIGDRILQTYETVKSQTFKDWEWVIVNDSCDGGKTQEILEQLSKEDKRVRVYQFTERTKGCIGEAKFRAAGLCRGDFLLELDHDDLLHPQAFQCIIDAADYYPWCGFFYTDCVEVDQNYNCPKYPEGFALGYGSYRTENYIGLDWETQNTVPTNPLTIRHIVGVPNHIRCWRSEVYHQIHGYNEDMTIADDYELIVRTFLVTKFCRIAKLLYFQRFDGNNSQDNGNRQDIQYRVREISKFYRKAIAKRFEELGIDDFADKQLDDVPALWAIPPRGKEYDVNVVYNPD